MRGNNLREHRRQLQDYHSSPNLPVIQSRLNPTEPVPIEGSTSEIYEWLGQPYPSHISLQEGEMIADARLKQTNFIY